ncbi:MAG: branched-chain amino acid ABC transporter permease [Tissierellaceae bacterium]|jgi:branched-chain amino acid transport system permease protein|nr:branched-chain amino acid ABC transporter permease [Tissierellia bacterium]
MEHFIQQIVNGISLGSIYALMALGYTMVYGIIKLINFAHGEIYMVGAYIGYALTTFFNFGFFPALILSMILTSLLGVVIEKVAYKPMRNSTRIAALITAIAVSMFLQYGMMYFVTPQTRSYPNILPDIQVSLFGTNAVVDIRNIYILTVTIVLMLLLQYVIHKTKTGKAMRAVALDGDASQLMGIDMNKTISYTFAIGSALAGAAGVLVGIYYNTINPLMGAVPGLKAFIAAVIGGIGVIPGAVFGGFFLGVTETVVSALGGSLYKDAVAFAILILVLLIKPNGIFGSNQREKV